MIQKGLIISMIILVNQFLNTDLEEAIKNGHLSPYDYHPVIVPLTDEELELYLEISEVISFMMATGKYNLEEENTPLQIKLIERARIVANAKNKLDYLKN